MKWIILAFLLISLSTSSFSVDPVAADYGACPEEEYRGLTCTIDSVTIDGCRKDRNSNACKLKRNVMAGININFTPDFSAENATTMMAYAMMPGIEKAFPDMDPDACKFMTCPVVEGQLNTYSFGLKLASHYPLGLFNVRFLMENQNQPKCCFITKFRIEK